MDPRLLDLFKGLGWSEVQIASFPAMMDLLVKQFKWDGWALHRYYEGLAAQTTPGLAATAGSIAVGALPVLTQVGVFVALGSGYAQARALAREEETTLGFSHGIVTGLMRWAWPQVELRFWRKFIRRNHFDDQMDMIRTTSYNKALLAGYTSGAGYPSEVAKALLKKIRSLAVTSTVGWKSRSDDWQEQARAQLVQRIHVENMARAARIHGIIKSE